MSERQRLSLWASIVVASIGAGFAVAEGPNETLLVCSAVLVIILLAGARTHIPRIPRFRIAAANADERDDGAFSTPRQLMYAGLLTSCLLKLRVHGVTLSDALFLLAFGLAVIESIQRRDHHRVLSDMLWTGIAIFVTGGLISTLLRSADKLSSVGIIARVFYLIAAWLWTGAKSLRTREHLWIALKLWVASAAICGYWTVGQKYGGLPGSIDAGRFAGLADHVNDLGALAACAIVPALVLTWRDRRWGWGALGVAIGLFLSASVGGGIAALVALTVGLLSPDLTRPILVALTVGIIGVLLATPVVGTTAITRFGTTTNSSARFNQGTFAIRSRTYALAWDQIKRDPFVGTGLDTPSSELFDVRTETFYQVHNLFLGAWFEGGILGLIGILVLEAALLKAAWRQVKLGHDRLLSLALLSGFVAYLIDEMSEPALYKRYSLVPALLVVALGYQAQRSAVAEGAVRSGPPGEPWRIPVLGDALRKEGGGTFEAIDREAAPQDRGAAVSRH
jgi:hypothetical protein